MNTIVNIIDKAGLSKVIQEFEVSLPSETVSVQTLIEARIRKEVEDYNDRLPDYYMGLVQPAQAEKTLNGFRMKERKKIDAEKQVYIALDAFQKNAYFILIDNKQVESLEQQVKLSSNTHVSFIKLTPLVGG